MSKKIAEVLENSGLTQNQIEKLLSIFKHTLELNKGDFFYKNTQICNEIGILKSGVLRYYYDIEKAEVTRWVALEGDFVTSLGSFIAQKPVSENIQALQNCEIMYAKRAEWQQLYESEAFVREIWTKTIEENYISMENRLYNTIALTGEQRYEWILKEFPLFNIHVQDKYLASMLGITPRHLSRIRANRK